MKINKEKRCHKCIEDLIIITKHTQSKEKIPLKEIQAKKDIVNVVTGNIYRDSDVQLRSTNARIAISLVMSVACATRKKVQIQKRIKPQSTSAEDWYSFHARLIMWSVRLKFKFK